MYEIKTSEIERKEEEEEEENNISCSFLISEKEAGIMGKEWKNWRVLEASYL